MKQGYQQARSMGRGGQAQIKMGGGGHFKDDLLIANEAGPRKGNDNEEQHPRTLTRVKNEKNR